MYSVSSSLHSRSFSRFSFPRIFSFVSSSISSRFSHRFSSVRPSSHLISLNSSNEFSLRHFSSGAPSRPWVDPAAVPSGDFLKKYCVDLTELARKEKLDPVIGREEEMRRTIEILCRRTKNNPAIIGDPGVGKEKIFFFSALANFF